MLANLALKTLAFKARAFEKSTLDPIRAQEKVLFEYLNRNKNTEYGRKYGLSGVKTIDDFRAKVPISDYMTVKSYVDRMAGGELNVLTSDKPIFFGITSGTSGNPKLIPVTKYSMRKKSDLTSLWAYYMSHDHPHILEGKMLVIISPEVKSFTSAKIPYGPEDGHGYNNMPWVVKRAYVLPYNVFYIENYDARYYCILRISMEHRDITSIATLNPSTIGFLCERIENVQEEIINDIEKGALSEKYNIPDYIRKPIEASLRPNPNRAKELRAILKRSGKLLPKDFWPEMTLIECWKGGTVKLYLKDLPHYFGNVPFRDFGCLSTESRNSIPLCDEGAGGVLAISTNFYEFIPRSEIQKDDKKTLLCNQLEKGKEYLIIVTTAGGLYRLSLIHI